MFDFILFTDVWRTKVMKINFAAKPILHDLNMSLPQKCIFVTKFIKVNDYFTKFSLESFVVFQGSNQKMLSFFWRVRHSIFLQNVFGTNLKVAVIF